MRSAKCRPSRRRITRGLKPPRASFSPSKLNPPRTAEAKQNHYSVSTRCLQTNHSAIEPQDSSRNASLGINISKRSNACQQGEPSPRRLQAPEGVKKSDLSQARAKTLVDSQGLSGSAADCPSIFSHLPAPQLRQDPIRDLIPRNARIRPPQSRRQPASDRGSSAPYRFPTGAGRRHRLRATRRGRSWGEDSQW